MAGKWLLFAIALAMATPPRPAQAFDSERVIEAEYRCESGRTIFARYENSDRSTSRARLTIQGKAFDLKQAISASGARYTTEQGLRPDTGLEWWIKGDDATLSEMPLGHAAPETTPIDTCTAKGE